MAYSGFFRETNVKEVSYTLTDDLLKFLNDGLSPYHFLTSGDQVKLTDLMFDSIMDKKSDLGYSLICYDGGAMMIVLLEKIEYLLRDYYQINSQKFEIKDTRISTSFNTI